MFTITFFIMDDLTKLFRHYHRLKLVTAIECLLRVRPLVNEAQSNDRRNQCDRKEGNVLFNDALNTFYLRLYGVGHMVKDHSNSERGNPLPPHGLLFPINSNGSFICTIPQTG